MINKSYKIQFFCTFVLTSTAVVIIKNFKSIRRRGNIVHCTFVFQFKELFIQIQVHFV